MGETAPRLRSDLEMRAESPDLHAPVLLKDPIVKRFYRFSPVQAAVLRRLDGTSTIEEVAEAASRESNAAVDAAQVTDFTAKLRGLLLLDHPACWAQLEAIKHKGKRAGNLLSIKVRAFNPDRLLTRLEGRMRFLFSPVFLGAGAAAMLGATVISIVNWDELSGSVTGLLNLYSIPLILVVGLTVSTLHEFGHGLALKRFGGKVEEMGFLLLYFMPAFYCDVSDAWLLERRQRYWVTLAGGFVQLLVWAVATLMWRLLSPEIFASRVCLVVIAFSGIQTLFNFNPLIRLDGYYLLSDYLAIPNLRPKAFQFFRDRLAYWFLGQQSALPGAGPSRRERRILWRYGLCSLTFSAGLAWVGISRMAAWLVEHFQMWGVALLSAACFMSVQIASKEVAASGRFLGVLAARLRKTPRTLLALGIVLGGGALPWELKVAGEFTVKPADQVSVGAQIEGTIRSVRVDEGQPVRRGDVLAELENLTLVSDYEQTEGELAEKRASLKLLLAGTRPEEIAKAKRQLETRLAEFATSSKVEEERASLHETVKKREAELKNAKEVYERQLKLARDGLISKNDLDKETLNYEVKTRELLEAKSQISVLQERTDRIRQVKKKEVDEARSQLDLLQAGSRPEQIDAARAEVDRLAEKVKNLSQQMQYLKICSPIDGLVATAYLRNRIGEYVKRGDTFCQVVSAGKVLIEMPVPEKEIADVS